MTKSWMPGMSLEVEDTWTCLSDAPAAVLRVVLESVTVAGMGTYLSM